MNLTILQKKRLASASQEALNKRQTLHLSQISGVGRDRLAALREQVNEAEARFGNLLAARGLCVGDLVRIIIDGPYKGVEAKVEAIENFNRIVLVVDGTELLPYADDVVLADERNYDARRRAVSR